MRPRAPTHLAPVPRLPSSMPMISSLTPRAASASLPVQPSTSPVLLCWPDEELAYKGATLILRGAVDGVIASLVVLSLGDSAGWSPSLTVTMDATLLGCLAAYSAGREALEIVTYKAYYQRERQREAWGEWATPANT